MPKVSNKVLELMGQMGHEALIGIEDIETGLYLLVAIHNTNLGLPLGEGGKRIGLGGLRWKKYSNEEEAMIDVLRLSRGMTYKSALAGLPLGGAKAVILDIGCLEQVENNREHVMEAVGRCLLDPRLERRYITAADYGTNVSDMEVIKRVAPGLVTGFIDPSLLTAKGVYLSMRAAAQYYFDNPSLKDKVIVVMGVGKVGSELVRLLVDEGATVKVSDINPSAIERIKRDYPRVTVVSQHYAMRSNCFILSPCATGGVINSSVIHGLSCDAIVGAANNQLDEENTAQLLADRGITFAPDYVVNAGGIISVMRDLPNGFNLSMGEIERKVERIPQTLSQIFAISEEQCITPLEAANAIVEEYLR